MLSDGYKALPMTILDKFLGSHCFNNSYLSQTVDIIQEQLLPAAIVSAENQGSDEVVVRWHFNKDAGPMYRIVVNTVNVVGAKFTKVVNSNISFECLQEENNETIPGIQHSWNVTSGSQCHVKGLTPGMTYR